MYLTNQLHISSFSSSYPVSYFEYTILHPKYMCKHTHTHIHYSHATLSIVKSAVWKCSFGIVVGCWLKQKTKILHTNFSIGAGIEFQSLCKMYANIFLLHRRIGINTKKNEKNVEKTTSDTETKAQMVNAKKKKKSKATMHIY